MQAVGLIDAGAMLALLDADDGWHAVCAEAFRTMRLPLATTAAVLAELFHLLECHPRALDRAWGFLRCGAVTVLPIGDDDLPRTAALMRQYADRPMDFEDATLVRLAERESLNTVFSIDHADFETYRIDGRRRFRILPELRP
jgi:predicted nucleic acid-binding protein